MADTNPAPFNPLDKQNLAESIALAISRADATSVPPPPSVGYGLYFLYYAGKHPDYMPLVSWNRGACIWPIYIGKSLRSGVRKGDPSQGSRATASIYGRLKRHADSIVGGGLEISDFRCRWLVMDEAFIHLGETLLISKYRPVWNIAVEGFGNNPVGGPRSFGQRTAWDTLHHGRLGMAAGEGKRSLEAVREAIALHFATTLPPERPDQPGVLQ